MGDGSIPKREGPEIFVLRDHIGKDGLAIERGVSVDQTFHMDSTDSERGVILVASDKQTTTSTTESGDVHGKPGPRAIERFFRDR